MTQLEVHKTSTIEDHSKQSPDLGSLTDALLRSRRFVVAAMLLSALTLGAVFALLFFSIPRQQIFGHAVSFKFAGVDQGVYPSGLPFSIGDLVAPAVLSKVFEENSLDKYGLDRAKFAASISIVPYSPLLDGITDRFQTRLNDRKLSFVERQQIERQQRDEIEKASNAGALIRFHYDGRVPFDVSFGEKIVHDVASSWADHMASRMGVLQIVTMVSERPLVDEKSFAAVSDVIGMTLLASGVARLDTALRQIKKVRGIGSIVSSQNKLSAVSVEQELEDVEVKLLLEPSSAEARNSYVERRKAYLQAERQAFLSRGSALQSAMSGYLETDRNNQGAGETSGASSSTGGGTITQLDSEYIDRVINLTERAFNQAYRRELTDQQIGIRNSAAEVEAAERRFGILAQEALATPRADGNVSKTAERLMPVAARLNAIGRELYDIARMISLPEVSPRRLLYADAAVPSRLSYSTKHPLIDPWVIFSYFAGILGVGLLTAAVVTTWILANRLVSRVRD